MIRDRVVDVVQPDVMYNGGMVRILRVADMAEAAGMSIMPHSPKAGAEGAAVLHFCSVVPNLGPHQEWWGDTTTPVSWYTPGFEIKNGKISVPDGPGLGVTYDPDIWEKAERLY
jgi:L-alanine-DL-glutamate epimerase-like enolase superfamily enzyme